MTTVTSAAIQPSGPAIRAALARHAPGDERQFEIELRDALARAADDLDLAGPQAVLERIPNYGERRRAGEAISTAFTESAVNQVISKRMVKKQQMRWTPRGAHLLLQIRTHVLNDQLSGDFHRWYPSFSRKRDAETLAA
jgi:hypothetical protein